MAFLKVGENGKVSQRRATKKVRKGASKRKPKGIVYILKFYLGDTEDDMRAVYKIGVAARRIRPLETRINEICTDHFMKYRYFPFVRPRKFSKTEYYFEIESHLHKVYKDKRYHSSKPFDGHTEFFQIEDEEELIAYYEKVMKDPLEYITPTDKATEVQEKIEKASEESSINDIEPVGM